jgi:hypothetical protein
MKKEFRYPLGALMGFVLGSFLVHPFSMVFQGLVHPSLRVDLNELLNAFNPHHLPMAFFFGLLGAVVGSVILVYSNALTREKEKVKLLEGLLPMCAWCKKIRDDSGTLPGKGQWLKVENYIARKTDASFTHGICPECFDKVTKGQ